MTRLALAHRVIGQIRLEHQRVGQGWSYILGKIREAAERRGGAPQGMGSTP